jgi:hypothetical protein
MKKLLPIFIVILLVIGAGSFYGGMKYGTSARSTERSMERNLENFKALSGERSEAFKQFGGRAGVINGEIIGRDEESIIIQLSDNSSRIIFFSDITQVSKTAEGSADDLKIGEQVMVSGEQNSDGSYTADIIQLSSRVFIPRENR